MEHRITKKEDRQCTSAVTNPALIIGMLRGQELLDKQDILHVPRGSTDTVTPVRRFPRHARHALGPVYACSADSWRGIRSPRRDHISSRMSTRMVVSLPFCGGRMIVSLFFCGGPLMCAVLGRRALPDCVSCLVCLHCRRGHSVLVATLLLAHVDAVACHHYVMCYFITKFDQYRVSFSSWSGT